MGTINDKLTAIGDAIRSKTGGEDLLSLDEMASEIRGLNVGGTRNFTIVGSPTVPSNPSENMVWVRTYVDICGWSMNSVRPDVTEEGYLWIRTDNELGVKMNLHKDCDTSTRIISSEQYIFGEWCQVITHVYQGGEWIDTLRGVIYHRGVINEAITGGFEEYYNYYSNNFPGSMVFEDNGEQLRIYRPVDKTGYGLISCGTVNAVDLSGFSKLIIKYYANNNGYFFVYQDKPASANNMSYQTYASIISGYDANDMSSPMRTATIDISTINKEMYIFVRSDVANSGLPSGVPIFIIVHDIHME